jgi:hypothetical protein
MENIELEKEQTEQKDKPEIKRKKNNFSRRYKVSTSVNKGTA